MWLNITLLLITAFTSPAALAAPRIKGYITKRGTYVAPHFKTRSDKVKFNNYSAKGNTNPYTGKRGKKKP